MNTLVDDLRTLVNKHLSSIEDVFVNNRTFDELKTIKKAIKNLNWKWILYFLQRYQRSILRQAYMISFSIENSELIKYFEPMFTEKERRWLPCYYNRLKYITKSGQYDKLDQLRLLPVHKNFDEAMSKLHILKGLIIRNDLKTIKSNRYGDLVINGVANLRSVVFKIFKHGRFEILDYIENKGIVISDDYLLIAKLEYGHVISKTDVDMLGPGMNACADEDVVKALAESNYYEYAEELVEKDQPLVLTYIDGLVFRKRFDALEIFKSKTNIDKQEIALAIVQASFIHDNLELFIKYIYNCNLEVFLLSNNSFKILAYIIDTKMCIKLNIEYISDPRIIKMLYAFVENGGVIVIENYNDAPPYVRELDPNAARKLLSEYEQDNCFL